MLVQEGRDGALQTLQLAQLHPGCVHLEPYTGALASSRRR